ncbi:hypothetical protein BDN67DRAFT_985841 [Paxillus ammoniavirescens]|nr:hypothetical protein BDN67DRAFT_985841 [Paxillus ammoniavirescens]
MDATSANNVLNVTANTIVDLLWGEVCNREWATAVGRMDNAMHAVYAVIQHADVIPGIVIAVEQLLHPEAAMKMEEEDEEDVVYRRQQKEHTKGKKRVDATEGESLLGKRKADEALKDEREHGRSRMCRSSSKITTAQPTLIHQPGGRMTTSKKAARPKRMMKAQQAAEHRMMTTPTPAPPSTPPHTPIPVPNPTQRRQGHQGCQRGAPQPLATPQPVNTCLTCVDFGVLCKPNLGYSCFTCRSHKKKSQEPSEALVPRSQCPSCAASSKRGTSINTQPPANPQDHPNMASSSMGIMLCIPPSQATHKSFQINEAAKDINHPTAATMIRMESAPQTSAVKAPVNMGLIPGTTLTYIELSPPYMLVYQSKASLQADTLGV